MQAAFLDRSLYRLLAFQLLFGQYQLHSFKMAALQIANLVCTIQAVIWNVLELNEKNVSDTNMTFGG